MAFVGVDLGGTQLRVAVADDRGNLRTVVRRATEAARGRDHVIKRIVDAVKEAAEEDGTPPRRVRALGIGLPGLVDPAAGLLVTAGHLARIHYAPFSPRPAQADRPST